MKEQILINGVNLKIIEKELNKLKEESTKIISKNIEEAISLIKNSIHLNDFTDMKKQLNEAKSLILQAKSISEVIGIDIYLEEESEDINQMNALKIVENYLNGNFELDEYLNQIDQNLEDTEDTEDRVFSWYPSSSSTKFENQLKLLNQYGWNSSSSCN